MTYLRLIPYGIAALCVIVALVFYNLWTVSDARASAETLRASNALAQNTTDAKTIERITAARAADDVLLRQLSEQVATINAVQSDTVAKIEELARTNAQVQSYLSVALPDDLLRVLNATTVNKSDDGNGTSAGSVNGSLPKADRQH